MRPRSKAHRGPLRPVVAATTCRPRSYGSLGHQSFGMSPRINPVEPPDEEDVQADVDALMSDGMDPLKPFRPVAQNPRVLDRMRLGGLLDEDVIGMRERALAIMRACANCDCEYEWGVHVVGFSAAAGLSDDCLAATVHGGLDAAVWSETEALVVRRADELYGTAGVPDGLRAELEVHWEPSQLIQHVMVIGRYPAVCFTADAFEVEPVPLARSFPEAPATT